MSHTQYPPQAPVPGGAPGGAPVAARNGLGVTALVLGLIGAACGMIPLLFWLSGILGLLALIFGFIGRGRAKHGEATNKGVALAGLLLGLISLILAVVGVVITMSAVSDAVDEVNKTLDKASAQAEDATAKSGGEDGEGKGSGDAKKAASKTYGPGETAAYSTGVNVTVSKASPYSPKEFSTHESGKKAYKVTVKIENKGKERFDANLVMVEARAGKGGTTASEIYDEGLDGFSGTVLPGKTMTKNVAFDVPPNSKDLDVEVTPGISHDAMVWGLSL